jgi:hypothetical protein
MPRVLTGGGYGLAVRDIAPGYDHITMRKLKEVDRERLERVASSTA